MTGEELNRYINERNGQLTQNSILAVLDSAQEVGIDHIEQHGEKWEMWDINGNHYSFVKKG